MSAPIDAADGQIDHRCRAARQEIGEPRRIDREIRPLADARHFIGARATLIARLRENKHVAKSHLAQPRPAHERAHFLVIDKHDPRAARPDIVIGRLNQLTAGRRHAPGHVSRCVFLRVAHVEEIERARRVFAQSLQIRALDAPDPETIGYPVGSRSRPCQRVRRGIGRAPRLPAVAGESGEVPAHRAVA